VSHRGSPVRHLPVAHRFVNFVDYRFSFDDVVGIVEELEASQKDEELPAFVLVNWFLFSDKSRAAARAQWNAMSYPQKDRVARKTAFFAMFLLMSVAAYLEYLFDLHSVWITFLGGSIASFACLYPWARWQQKQRRLRASRQSIRSA
jgi:hypothetical protein